MARSVWKGPFIDGYLMKKADKVRESGRNEVIKTWSRQIKTNEKKILTRTHKEDIGNPTN